MEHEAIPKAGDEYDIGTYRVQQYELHVTTYEVEARSIAWAIRRVLDGDGNLVEPSPELCGVLNDRGMRVEEGSELANALRELDVPVENSCVLSIRSVERQP
ncbi:MAG: hypothetical protein KDA57_16555 [Planctomycetales bacterium]|nr:hypothetical protein [Planctomycetales bacterium]